MLNRPLCKRTFPGRTASSPTQLSRALTSLRTPDHAVPNDAALCRSRGERVQLSFFCSIPSCRWIVREGSPGLQEPIPCLLFWMRLCDKAMHVVMRRRDPVRVLLRKGAKAGETEGGTSCRKKTTYEPRAFGFLSFC